MADISGKHIVITGGSIGIGYGVIQKCLEAGAAVSSSVFNFLNKLNISMS